jgi:hypothetical protein
MSQERNDPKHWREHAAKARAQADQMHNQGSRDTLLCIARSYDMLAERAAERRSSLIRLLQPN